MCSCFIWRNLSPEKIKSGGNHSSAITLWTESKSGKKIKTWGNLVFQPLVQSGVLVCGQGGCFRVVVLAYNHHRFGNVFKEMVNESLIDNSCWNQGCRFHARNNMPLTVSISGILYSMIIYVQYRHSLDTGYRNNDQAVWTNTCRTLLSIYADCSVQNASA